MPAGYWEDFCWLDRLLLKNVYDLAKNFQIFFKNMSLTLFYLERHVMESKHYFWELIFMLMPTRVSRRFLLIGPSFAENVYDLAKKFQIFFKNMLLTLLYLERHVMESKNYFWELIFALMPTRVSRRFLLIGPSFAENVYDLAKNSQIFFKNMLLTLFYLEIHVMESKNYFWELIFILMPTWVLRGFLLKNVYDLAKNFQIFFKNMLLTLFYLERHVMESKNYFWELIFTLDTLVGINVKINTQK